MKHPLLILSLLVCLTASFASCQEDTGEVDEHANWRARNEAAFADTLAKARTAIAEARAAHGDDWEAHCPWRLLRTYALPDGAAAESTDTVCIYVVNRGTGSGSPLYTDSVRVNYLLRELPTASYPEGRIHDHSGYSEQPDDIFSPQLGVPATLLVSNTVEGFTTAIMHMHIGDRWRVYVPWQLGYGDSDAQNLPAYSLLRFEIELKAYYRAGIVPDPWLTQKK